MSIDISNLIRRVITSVILITLVLVSIFCLNKIQFGFVTGLVSVWAAWEWSRLAGLDTNTKKKQRWVFMLDFMTMLVLAAFAPLLGVMIAGILAWFLIPLRFFKLAGVIMLPVCWKALNYLCFVNVPYKHPVNALILLLFVYLADISAYFMGNWFGKHKLAPLISPGKSIEGLIGALVMVSAVTAVLFYINTHNVYSALSWVVLAVITVLVSVMGDLFESFMKRQQGLKDSGRFLPGHGGLLDRIDSLITAAPVFVLGLMFLVH